MENITPPIRWMTCRELAEARGITTASATRLAFRRKWRRQRGNDGNARVAVPVGEDQAHRDETDYDTAPDRDPVNDDTTCIIDALKTALATLRDELILANNPPHQTITRGDRTEAARDAERTRADQRIEEIEALQARLADAGIERDEARARAAELVTALAVLECRKTRLLRLADALAGFLNR
jgi:hypothetical protein